MTSPARMRSGQNSWISAKYQIAGTGAQLPGLVEKGKKRSLAISSRFWGIIADIRASGSQILYY